MSPPAFPELLHSFARIGLLSFGGPAAQISLMHDELVTRRGWLSEQQFLGALSFCMLLPGPEAMQLATYAGWRLRGVPGGLLAGLLFVLPGAVVILALGYGYAVWGGVPLVQAAFLGVKAAVVAIVVQALMRLAGKALARRAHLVVAGLSFVGIFALDVPFPAIIAAAAAWGWAQSRGEPAPAAPAGPSVRPAATLATAAVWGGLWAAPILVRLGRGGGVSHRSGALLLETGGGDLRRRLCGAGLHGRHGGRAEGMDHRRADDRRPRAGRDHARTAHPRDAIRRAARGLDGGRGGARAGRGRADALGDVRAVFPVDLHRRAACRAPARAAAAARRARGDFRGRGGRDRQPVAVVRAACRFRRAARRRSRPGAGLGHALGGGAGAHGARGGAPAGAALADGAGLALMAALSAGWNLLA